MFKAGDPIKLFFIVRDPTTQGSVSPDASTLAAVVFHNGAEDDNVVLTITESQGLCQITGTMGTMGYDVNDDIAVIVSYAIASVYHFEVVYQGKLASPFVQLDLTQYIPLSNADNTVGDCMNAARADGFGMWTKNGLNLTLFAPDGATPVRVFVLDDASRPTSRT